MSTDEEKLRFSSMINALLSGKYKQASIDCPNASSARRLRRRFYHLRDSLSGEVRLAADKCNFRLSGRQVIVELKPNWKPQFDPKGANDEPSDQPTNAPGN